MRTPHHHQTQCFQPAEWCTYLYNNTQQQQAARILESRCTQAECVHEVKGLALLRDARESPRRADITCVPCLWQRQSFLCILCHRSRKQYVPHPHEICRRTCPSNSALPATSNGRKNATIIFHDVANTKNGTVGYQVLDLHRGVHACTRRPGLRARVAQASSRPSPCMQG